MIVDLLLFLLISCMRRKRQTNNVLPGKSLNPQFYLHQESPQTNQAKAVLMELCTEVDPILQNQGLTSWGNFSKEHVLFRSHRGFQSLKYQELKEKKEVRSHLLKSVRNWRSSHSQYGNKHKQHSESLFLGLKNNSEAVKPSSAPLSVMLQAQTKLQAPQGYKSQHKPKSQKQGRKLDQQRNGVSLPIAKFLLQHLYKNRRQWKLGNGRMCMSKNGETSNHGAGLKGRRQHQMWKSQIELLK